ncbi:hypothetical protein M404DRAFT_998377 [Pisolithus tinctorius Marx 270]|uniref:DUF6533 domain-containing protein n=1 Tax=Pisolithus tinctorius Marx 270 TaxID=870435 RepID=A0A0C3P1K4_PISTI|nr:hypothetical protein M404DRAFT_998377 [Pisolithus tinctorius Marx 270]
MSISSSQAAFATENSVFAYVQIAATAAALYDHILFFGREIELIWGTAPSIVTVLYIIDRYLGDAVLLAGVCRAFVLRAQVRNRGVYNCSDFVLGER